LSIRGVGVTRKVKIKRKGTEWTGRPQNQKREKKGEELYSKKKNSGG